MKNRLIILAVLIIMIMAGCAPQSGAPDNTAAQQEQSSAAVSAAAQPSATESQESAKAQQTSDTKEVFAVSSGGISEGVIDPVYGDKVSLPLEITGAPDGAVCFAVYMDDIDSQPLCGYRWVHWMAVNITDASLPEDFCSNAGSAVQGRNDFGDVGYGGPAPPDKDHTYVITVYALDDMVPLGEGFSKEEFSAAIEGHVLASASLEGLYKK